MFRIRELVRSYTQRADNGREGIGREIVTEFFIEYYTFEAKGGESPGKWNFSKAHEFRKYVVRTLIYYVQKGQMREGN